MTDMARASSIVGVIFAALVVLLVALGAKGWSPEPSSLRQGLPPNLDQPIVVAGLRGVGTRPLDKLSLTYPEAAVEAGDGSIYVANALGFAVERIHNGYVTTVLSGSPDDLRPSIFTDLRLEDGDLYALDGANAKIWRIGEKEPQVVFTAPAPAAYDAGAGKLWDTEYLLSSLDVKAGRFLVTGARVIWQGGAQQYGVERNSLYIGRANGDWLEVPGARSISEKYGSYRDAVWMSDGSILAHVGEYLVHLAAGSEVAALYLDNNGHGGGIVEAGGGWIVGAHTKLVFVSDDLSSSREMDVRFPTANIGHLSWSDGSLLLTDTDRQTVYLVDADTGVAEAQYGNNGGDSFKIVALEVDGNRLLMLDNATPRVMAYVPETGSVTSVAGDGVQGYDGPAAASEFSFQYPSGMIADPNGGILVTEANYRIARVANDRVEIFAGDIASGVPTDAKSFSEARFGSLRGMAIDAEGRLLVVDQTHHTVWRFEADGTVSKVMGQGAPGQWTAGEIARDQPLNHPSGLLVRKDGTILIADAYNHVVVGIDKEGRTFPFAGSIKGTTYQGHGDYSGDGGLATNAKLNTPRQMAEDGSGNIYIVDEFNNAIRKVTPDGTISTFAGGRFGFSEDGSAMNLPQDAAVLGDHLYVADTGNSIVWAFPLQ